MHLLIDTHVLVWLGIGDSRVGEGVIAAMRDRATQSYVSAVTAWEFYDLQLRGRFPPGVDFFADLIHNLDITVLPLPSETWRIAALLPRIHLDPIDRMVVAHALTADLTLVTADRQMRQYPVRHLW